MPLFHIRCPAKVNLSLSVLERDEAAGMHFLDSVLAKIDLYDELSIRIEPVRRFEARFHWATRGPRPAAIAPAQNTMSRAYDLLDKALGNSLPGMSVTATNAIPAGAGLGGASSDAAGLIKLIRFLGTRTAALPTAAAVGLARMDARQLVEMASRVGADVPAFLCEGPVRVGGFGEEVTKLELPGLEDYRLLLVFPPQPLSTGEMYARIGESARHNHTAGFVERWTTSGPGKALRLAHNDFEEVARQALPIIGDVIDSLRAQRFPLVSLTGTGSAVFVLLKRDAAVEQLNLPREVRISGPHVFVHSDPCQES